MFYWLNEEVSESDSPDQRSISTRTGDPRKPNHNDTTTIIQLKLIQQFLARLPHEYKYHMFVLLVAL